MIAFAILSILLLLGMVFGSPQIKPIADSLFPWSLVVFAVAGISMVIANARSRDLIDADPARSGPARHARAAAPACAD